MIHYSCDLCGAPLEGSEHRFVVKIDVYAAADEREATGQADDLDDVDGSLEEITSSLSHADDDDEEPADEAEFRGFRFDLCRRCQRRYLNDPLFRAAKKRMGFSEN
ncbi:MAG: hypothetical protein PHU85_13290 [Phycisphaerae bacterium]|nr:hypothetical protein [Phycisphaerae bacterium]